MTRHDDLVERVMRAICDYTTGPSDLNSCCAEPRGYKRCQVRARAAIAECFKDKERLERELAESQAQAAAMRASLDFYVSPRTHEWVWNLISEQTCSDLCDKTFESQGCPSGTCAKDSGERSWLMAHKNGVAALSTDAGKKMLDVVEEAEYLVENIREHGIHDNWKGVANALSALGWKP